MLFDGSSGWAGERDTRSNGFKVSPGSTVPRDRTVVTGVTSVWSRPNPTAGPTGPTFEVNVKDTSKITIGVSFNFQVPSRQKSVSNRFMLFPTEKGRESRPNKEIEEV